MDAFDSKTVSRLAGVSLRQIQYWDEQGFLRPSIKRATGKGSKRLYSFSDLVKLRVIKSLSDYGMNPGRIRICVRHLRRIGAMRWIPKGSLRYLTDGKELFVLTNDQSEMLEALDRQFVFSLAIGDVVDELHDEVRRLKQKPAAGGEARQDMKSSTARSPRKA